MISVFKKSFLLVIVNFIEWFCTWTNSCIKKMAFLLCQRKSGENNTLTDVDIIAQTSTFFSVQDGTETECWSWTGMNGLSDEDVCTGTAT